MVDGQSLQVCRTNEERDFFEAFETYLRTHGYVVGDVPGETLDEHDVRCDAAFKVYDGAEKFVLKHQPTNALEAYCVLEVLSRLDDTRTGYYGAVDNIKSFILVMGLAEGFRGLMDRFTPIEDEQILIPGL